jgi:choline dehydrogenase-like flavoprotein
LSEISDWRVLLLEAGGEEPLQADVPAFIPFNRITRFDWQYQTEPHEGYCGGKSCTWNAGKILGGGSVLNGMVYNRGNARSYDIWRELGKGLYLSTLHPNSFNFIELIRISVTYIIIIFGSRISDNAGDLSL